MKFKVVLERTTVERIETIIDARDKKDILYRPRSSWPKNGWKVKGQTARIISAQPGE